MGKRYTMYKQARLKSAFKKSADKHFPNFSGKTRKMSKPEKSPVLPERKKPLNVTIQVDTGQLTASFQKVTEAMTKSGKTFKILTDAISDAMVNGASAAVSMNNHYMTIDEYFKFEKRWTMLQALGWIRDPEGGLVSPNTLDIVDPAILDDVHEFKRFVDYYLATGKVGEWVPCRYVVPAVEKIALPLDSVRKQLEERISE